MKLCDYLKSQKITAADFSKKIGVSSVSIHRWLVKKSIPRPDQMARIFEATDGAVRPEDFYPDIPNQSPATPSAGVNADAVTGAVGLCHGPPAE